MEQNNIEKPRRHKEWTGIFLIIVGGLLLVDRIGNSMHEHYLPSWVFTWPMLLIGIGLLTGLQHNFRNNTWLILVIIGSAFLIDEQFRELNLHELIWPGVLILIGAAFIFRRRSGWDKREWKNKWKNDWKDKWHDQNAAFATQTDDGEFIDSTNVFGGTKKVILSKNFTGGDITCFMGGAEIDFTQADIQKRVVLDVTMVFGGLKLTVPSNWDVKNEVTAVFGSVEDKRTVAATNFDPAKVLVLSGTAVFAGIEIRNF